MSPTAFIRRVMWLPSIYASTIARSNTRAIWESASKCMSKCTPVVPAGPYSSESTSLSRLRRLSSQWKTYSCRSLSLVIGTTSLASTTWGFDRKTNFSTCTTRISRKASTAQALASTTDSTSYWSTMISMYRTAPVKTLFSNLFASLGSERKPSFCPNRPTKRWRRSKLMRRRSPRIRHYKSWTCAAKPWLIRSIKSRPNHPGRSSLGKFCDTEHLSLFKHNCKLFNHQNLLQNIHSYYFICI